MHENIAPGREFVRGRDLRTKKWGMSANCEVLKSILKTGFIVRPDAPFPCFSR